MISAAVTGFATGFSLILAIGAQNAFVLRQGLVQAHVFVVVMICALSDAALIALGVAGAGTLAAKAPWLISFMTWAGAIFLFGYGLISLRRAFDPGRLEAAEEGAQSLKAAVLTALALSWLNPHVYLDTVGLIGAISTRFPGHKVAYALGAIAASFVFFFALGYGARLLAPFFARRRAWRILDIGIALVMWTIAATLIMNGA